MPELLLDPPGGGGGGAFFGRGFVNGIGGGALVGGNVFEL